MAASRNGKPTNVFTSQCFIGGKIAKMGVSDDGGYVLVDVGKASKFIFCEVYQDDKLAARLAHYEVGDHILLHGYVRAWSQKKDDEWVNKTSVRVTDIRSEDPVRQSRESVQQSFQGGDDDIPF